MRGADYTYSTTIDLSSATIQTTGPTSFLAFNFPAGASAIPLGVGETISGTITFDQILTLTDFYPPSPGNFNLTFIFQENQQGITADAYTFELDGVQGMSKFDNPTSGTGSGGGIVLGDGGFWSSDTLSFTGFTYSATVTSSFSSAYTPAAFDLMADFSTASLSPVPEPSTPMLAVVGFAGLLLSGALLRRDPVRV